MKTMTENMAGAFVCNMRIEFNLRQNVQFYGSWTFSVDSRRRITVVRTRIDSCVFDDNDTFGFLMQLQKIATYYGRAISER